MFTPTDEQNKVIKLAKEWWKDPERRNRPFVIQGLAGCVTDDTLILTDKGTIPFRDILSDYDKNYSNITGYYDYNGKYRVFDGERFSDISHLYFKGYTNGYELKTESGTILKASEDHPLLKQSDKEYYWKTVKHLNVDDYIAVLDNDDYKNYKCEKIISITEIKDYFYDITVPSTSMFITNGIISHNCGKSTSVEYIVDELGLDKELDVKYVAFTGQAAVNLNKKGNNATTIHRLIYDVFEDKKTHKIKFTLKEELEDDIKLILIDEVGMITQKLLDDLMSFNIPIIAMGDREQLKPVNGDMNDLLKHPDAELNTPMRQSLDSPILRVAYKILSGGTINMSDASQDGVYIVRKSEIPDDYLTNADQIIAGTNKTIDLINDRIRYGIFGLTSPFPYENEKLMCLQNNWGLEIDLDGKFIQSLTNGLTGYSFNFKDYDEKLHTFKLSFTPTYLDDNIVPNAHNTFNDILVDALYFRDHLRNDDTLYTDKKYDKIMHRRKIAEQTNFIRINKFMPGYAETTYKAQGSEWDNVFYFDEFWGGKDMFKRQRYVAVTRAKKNLVIAI